MKFLCDQCKAKYQIADEKAAGKTVRMKCRKCGHLIEVRAAVTETSSAGPAPAPAPAAASPAAPRAAAKPAPPRASALATSLASAKPAAKPAGKPPERPASALAGAFKSSVQREEEISAPFDMADLSPSDEWYVAINGVPVGPIRVAEVRRKAALGAVTEESLCWQEGLDEWRPVRSFPELALIVREAAASGRSSLPPSDRSSGLPPHRPSARPPAPAAAVAPVAPRQPPARPAPTAAPLAARSNVVPITSRLATAEKIVEQPDDLTRPQTHQPLPEPAVVSDPFANPPAPAAGRLPAQGTQQLGVMSESVAAAMAPPIAVAPEPARKAPPWMAIAMVAAACAFGVTAGIAVFFRPAAPATTVAQGPGPTAPVASQPGVAITPTATATATDTTAPEATTTAPSTKGPGAVAHGGPAPTAGAGTATAAAKGPLDLGGLGTGGPRPTDDPGGSGGGGPAPGSGITSAQIQQVIGLHQPGVKRSCWERNPTTKAAVNVSVTLTIGADGSASNVSANSDEASVGKCVENDVRTWHFPAMGVTQPTAFSLHFIRQ